MPAALKCSAKSSSLRWLGGNISTRRPSSLALRSSIMSSSRDSVDKKSEKRSVVKSRMAPLATRRSLSVVTSTRSGRTPTLSANVRDMAVCVVLMVDR